MTGGFCFGGLKISSLVFADDVVLLPSSGGDLQLALGQFAAECEASRKRISTSKSKVVALSQKRVCTPHQGLVVARSGV